MNSWCVHRPWILWFFDKKTWLMRAESRKNLWWTNSILKPSVQKVVIKWKCNKWKMMNCWRQSRCKLYILLGTEGVRWKALQKMQGLQVTKIHQLQNYCIEHFQSHFIGMTHHSPLGGFLVEKECFCQFKSLFFFLPFPNQINILDSLLLLWALRRDDTQISSLILPRAKTSRVPLGQVSCL